MNNTDTIFALSSGHGKSGVAVIRISGADLSGVFKKFINKYTLLFSVLFIILIGPPLYNILLTVLATKLTILMHFIGAFLGIMLALFLTPTLITMMLVSLIQWASNKPILFLNWLIVSFFCLLSMLYFCWFMLTQYLIGLFLILCLTLCFNSSIKNKLFRNTSLFTILFTLIFCNLYNEKINYTEDFFTKKVGYKSFQCESNTIKCKPYRIPKIYDNISLITPDKYRHCHYFEVEKNGKTYYIDKNNEKVLKNIDSVKILRNYGEYGNPRYIKFKKNNKYGLYRIDISSCVSKGIFLPAEYDSIESISSNDKDTKQYYILVKKDNLYSLYSESFPAAKLLLKNKNEIKIVPTDDKGTLVRIFPDGEYYHYIHDQSKLELLNYPIRLTNAYGIIFAR